jgi:hypothetical protein
MKEVKLTQLQSQILKPIIDNYTDAKANFEQAIVLITGEPFKNASIENGVLRYDVIEGKEKVNPNEII